MTMLRSISFLALVLSALLASVSVAESQRGNLANPDEQKIQLTENERVEEYHLRNYTWPIPDDGYSPNTPGWRNLMQTRFNQVEEIQDSLERYEGYIQSLHSAFLVPNFTAYGFGLARAPDDLTDALQQGIRDGLPTARFEEGDIGINGPTPLFVDRPDLTQRVLKELKHYAEEWSGVELTPYRAYGFRLYRNNSQLMMHVDKQQTHIISFIYHIDSSDDAEPWPIFIEDFNGNTHEVILTPGDILFYESSKCFHGRPKKLNGSFYSSLFVHYYPAHGWYEQNHELEAHYAVPPHWKEDPQGERKAERLEMSGTSLTEPGCPHDWCRAKDSIKWSGPGEDGFWIAPTMEKFPFHPKEESWHEDL
jgi:hypothetical protein